MYSIADRHSCKLRTKSFERVQTTTANEVHKMDSVFEIALLKGKRRRNNIIFIKIDGCLL